MVELTPKDSSILTRIARYQTIPVAKRKALLKDADSDKAKEIGEIILKGTSTGTNADPETKATADAYLKLLRGKRRIVRSKR